MTGKFAPSTGGDAVTHIEIDAGVRYWEDASVNGVGEDNDAPTIPLCFGDRWQLRIRLADGVIEGWPNGTLAEVHYKVCDEGIYWLTNADGERLFRWRGYYVPDDFLCPGTDGYGDYIIMTIGSDGKIADWSKPEINTEDWLPTPPSGEASNHG